MNLALVNLNLLSLAFSSSLVLILCPRVESDVSLQVLVKSFLTGDFSDWPLDQGTACELVRVRMVRAPNDTKTSYRELRVRSAVVKRMAQIYMERHVHDLGRRFPVLKLMKVTEGDVTPGGRQTVSEQMNAHIEARVSREWPDSHFGGEKGGVPKDIQDMLDAGANEAIAADETGFDMKQATMPDMATSSDNLFEGVRPTLVLDEATTREAFSKEAVAESAMADKTSIIELQVSNSFENQFVSQYNCRVFPWALNYDCGGADYPDLFGDWERLERTIDDHDVSTADNPGHQKDRWYA